MKPTYEDIVKYHSQKTKLLVNIECYALPTEIQINAVIDDGAIFQFVQSGAYLFGGGGQWIKTDQVEVLHIFPPNQLLQRIAALEKEEELERNGKIIDEAGEKNTLTSSIVEQAFRDLGLDVVPKSPEPKPKKCKKKKNCK